MNPKGQGDLLDDAFGFGEDLCPVGHDGGDQRPEDHPHCKKGEVGADVLLEQLGVEDPHGQHGDGEAQGDPPRTQGRSAVALPDIEPPQCHPDVIGEKAPDQILFGFGDSFVTVRRELRNRRCAQLVWSPLIRADYLLGYMLDFKRHLVGREGAYLPTACIISLG